MNPNELKAIVEKLLPDGFTCGLTCIDHLYTVTITREADKRQGWTYVSEDESAAMISEAVRVVLDRLGAKPRKQDKDTA